MDMDPERREANAEADAMVQETEDEIARREVAAEAERQQEHYDAMMQEIQRMEEEVRRLKLITRHPRHSFMRLFIRDLETNPHAQYKVHRWGAYYWLINFPAVTLLFFLDPSVWLKWGLYITLIYSIYANFSTDYGAMSAAMAAYENKYLPSIPGVPFTGGAGGRGGSGGEGGAGGMGKNGQPGEQGEPGEPGLPGEPGNGNAGV